jgi:RNA polymerase sigma factor (sigma-70 family)
MTISQHEDIDHKALLTRMASGDENALSSFYHRFEAIVYAFAYGRLRDSMLAADVLNTVMFEVWRNAGKYEGRSTVRTWVLGITQFKVIDVLRRNKFKVVDLDDVSHELVDDFAPDPEGEASSWEDSNFIHRCIDRLPDVHRTILLLAFIENLSYPEIAQIADCPVGTVKSRVFHAKKLIKECLEHQMGGAIA